MIPLQHKVYDIRTHKKAESATKFQGKLGRLEGVGVESSGVTVHEHNATKTQLGSSKFSYLYTKEIVN